jgi:transposase InsO family protein
MVLVRQFGFWVRFSRTLRETKLVLDEPRSCSSLEAPPERPEDGLPASCAVDAILHRARLVQPRGKRPRQQPISPPRIGALAQSDVCSMAYKGWFRVGDGTRCDPLTINDVHSRASLVCQATVQPKSNDVRQRLEEVFGAFGLPK